MSNPFAASPLAAALRGCASDNWDALLGFLTRLYNILDALHNILGTAVAGFAAAVIVGLAANALWGLCQRYRQWKNLQWFVCQHRNRLADTTPDNLYFRDAPRTPVQALQLRRRTHFNTFRQQYAQYLLAGEWDRLSFWRRFRLDQHLTNTDATMAWLDILAGGHPGSEQWQPTSELLSIYEDNYRTLFKELDNLDCKGAPFPADQDS